MNRFFLVMTMFIITAQKGLCLGEMGGSELDGALKTTSSEPNFLTMVFALLFVIFLIYITGLIYSKLNVIGAKTVRDQLTNYDLNRAIVISTTQLGQGKNLHVIELNKKHYLIGATQNSINLIKEISINEKKEENDINENSQPEHDIDDAIRMLYNSQREDTEVKEETAEATEEFDVHKKYLN